MSNNLDLNYSIIDDYIIFKPDYNEPLDNYNDIIKKYKKIIFSNFSNLKLAIILDNNFELDKENFSRNNFNQEIELKKYKNLEYLNLSNWFNKKIDVSNNLKLEYLSFGTNFNQKIDLSKNKKLKYLRFGVNFIQEIDLSKNKQLKYLSFDYTPSYFADGYYINYNIDLSNNNNLETLILNANYNNIIDLSNNNKLKKLVLGYNFNQEIDLSKNNNLIYLTIGKKFNKNLIIPLSVKSLVLYGCYNQFIIDNLHNNIEELSIINCRCEYDLNNLPNSLKKLIIKDYLYDLNNLPNSIEYLEFNMNLVRIQKKPKNLKTIKCKYYYEYIDEFKNYEVIYF